MGFSALVPFLPAVASLFSNVWSSREAAKNREFQERMSSTAYQRQLGDMRKAGVNPALAQLGSGGASAPSGSAGQISDMGPSTARSLELRILRAQEKLLEAQTRREDASTDLTNQQWLVLRNEMDAGKFELIAQQVQAGRLNLAQLQETLRIALEHAKAEVRRSASSARASEAAAALDEAARTGALNQQQFEQMVGETGPVVRFFLEILRSIRR